MSTPAVRILIVEDTLSLATAYALQLEGAGYAATVVHSGAEARERLADKGVRGWDVILLDLQLPDCDGLEILSGQPDLAANASVVVITTDGSIDRAIAAMRLGAYDFMVKPLARERLLSTCRNASERARQARHVKTGRRHGDRSEFHGFIGKSPQMQTVYQTIENIADSRATVFVTGESGTGKEVAAEAIHRAGKRRDRPFIAINCGAIPENLLESELFGHVRGAFTGATEHRAGAARLAHGGTLFLDEICEMELKLQVKLLRFLQTGTVQRVGSGTAEPVDVRVICATNRDPLCEVEAGRFREDLFYRLAVIPLALPSLRERGTDVELLAAAFIERIGAEEGRTGRRLADEAAAMLRRHSWPGNVRELQNAIRRAVVMGRGAMLSGDDLGVTARSPAPLTAVACSGAQVAAPPPGAWDGLSLEAIERMAIEQASERSGGNVPAAALALGVSPSTLYRKRERWEARAA